MFPRPLILVDQPPIHTAKTKTASVSLFLPPSQDRSATPETTETISVAMGGELRGSAATHDSAPHQLHLTTLTCTAPMRSHVGWARLL